MLHVSVAPPPAARPLGVVLVVLLAHAALLAGLSLNTGNAPPPAPTLEPPEVRVSLRAATPSVPAPAQPAAPPSPTAQRAQPSPPQVAAPALPSPAPAVVPAAAPTAPTPAPPPAATPAEPPAAASAPTPTPADAAALPGPSAATAATASAPNPGAASAAAPAAAASAAASDPVASAALVLPSSSAAHLHNPAPPYPALSRRLGEQGRVVLRVRIEADGRPSAVQLYASSGHARLDQAALQAVARWRFVPGTRDGVPEAMWFHVPLHFVLE